MDVLKDLIDKFIELVLKLPRAVQIIAAFFLMAVIGYVVYVLFPLPQPKPAEKSAFEAAYQQALVSLNPSEGAVAIKKTIENLMHLAATTQQRCDAGSLYLAAAGDVPDSMAPTLYAFLFSSSTSTQPPPCAVTLAAQAKQTQTRQVATAVRNETPAPHAGGGEAARRIVPETTSGGTAASQILQATTAVGTTGWMYLGVAAPGGAALSAARTIRQTKVPKPGDPVVTIANVNIRQMTSPLQSTGPVIGVASKGSTVTLTGAVVPVPQGSGAAARTLLWAPVSLSLKVRPPEIVQARASPESTASAPVPTPLPIATIAPAGGRNGTATTAGIDVSSFNGVIDWPSVGRDAVAFAFIRATQGARVADQRFETNWTASKSIGLVRGAYHFFVLDDDPGEQARNFLGHVKIEAGDLPAVLDIESIHGGDAQANAKKILTYLAVVDGATGRPSILYAGYADFATLFAAAPALSKHPLWIASYGVAVPEVPGNGTTWRFWQYAATGKVAGITGTVDLDRFNGSSDQLHSFASGR
jgi:GH25 family lysozyme M1 (1,4-beta-N-acetylmuramidase)